MFIVQKNDKIKECESFLVNLFIKLLIPNIAYNLVLKWSKNTINYIYSLVDIV